MQVQGVTVSVSDLARSKAFYEGVLGFIPDAYYEPTRWQPYKFEGQASQSPSERRGALRSIPTKEGPRAYARGSGDPEETRDRL